MLTRVGFYTGLGILHSFSCTHRQKPVGTEPVVCAGRAGMLLPQRASRPVAFSAQNSGMWCPAPEEVTRFLTTGTSIVVLYLTVTRRFARTVKFREPHFGILRSSVGEPGLVRPVCFWPHSFVLTHVYSSRLSSFLRNIPPD